MYILGLYFFFTNPALGVTPEVPVSFESITARTAGFKSTGVKPAPQNQPRPAAQFWTKIHFFSPFKDAFNALSLAV